MNIKKTKKSLADYYDRKYLKELYANNNILVTKAFDSVYIIFSAVLETEIPVGVVVDPEKIEDLLNNPKIVNAFFTDAFKNEEYEYGSNDKKFFYFNSSLLESWIKAVRSSKKIFEYSNQNIDFENRIIARGKREALKKKISTLLSSTFSVLIILVWIFLEFYKFSNAFFGAKTQQEIISERYQPETKQRLEAVKKFPPPKMPDLEKVYKKDLQEQIENVERTIASLEVIYVIYDVNQSENNIDYEVPDKIVITDDARYEEHLAKDNIKVKECTQSEFVELLKKALDNGNEIFTYKKFNGYLEDGETADFVTKYGFVSKLINIFETGAVD